MGPLRHPGRQQPAPSDACPTPAGDADTLMNDYLSRDDWHDVALLLRDGPTSWERSYPPLPEMANLVAELVDRCDGDRVEGC